MAMQTTGSNESGEPMMDINTTPLIDVMLVLLIMFIITIPPQTHAVKLQGRLVPLAAVERRSGEPDAVAPVSGRNAADGSDPGTPPAAGAGRALRSGRRGPGGNEAGKGVEDGVRG